MTIKRNLLLLIAIAIFAGVSPASVQAQNPSLADLFFNNGEITQDDKRLFNWNLEGDQSIDGFTGDPEPIDFSLIQVEGFTNGNGDHGVKYTDNGNQWFSEGGTFDLRSFTWTFE